MNRTLVATLCLYVIFAIASTFAIYSDALKSALQDDRRAGQVRLAEATGRLRSQLDKYRVLANLFSKNEQIKHALETNLNDNLAIMLARLSLTYGIFDIDIVSTSGEHLISSDIHDKHTAIPIKLVNAAINGRLGYQISIEGERRLVKFSRAVRNNALEPLGILIVTADLAQLEFQWPVIPEPLIFFNNDGVAVSSNRNYLWLTSKNDTANFPITGKNNALNVDLWTYRSANGGLSEVQILSNDVPLLQMQGSILLDTEDARSIALLRAGLALALLLAIGLIGTIILQQRRRIALEAQHTLTLEQRVDQRTAELHTAQNELVEASNLAALGRLSAGLSHELNQPLAAIMNFSENGKQFIKRQRNDNASRNFDLISEQIRRITRIINNLRAFARQEKTPTELVDFVKITKEAAELNKDLLRNAGVKISKKLPEEEILVLAGHVRLEQVISNLISNAVDAMQSSDKKHLTLELLRSKDNVKLSVSDSGPGIDEPERVFEPFYTTKELGASKGLGMGLALSFGLISKFGGELSCQNLDSGAEFTIILPVQEQRQ